MMSLATIVVLVAAGSFAAGWITATLRTTAPHVSQVTGPTQPGGGAPEPVASAPANGHSPTYTYSVQSNYPLTLAYIDKNGDRISLDRVTVPWTMQVTTNSWGADAEATVLAYAATDKGDAFVACTVTDASGKVVASDKEESAMPSASCYVG
jgi:serine/threonine-protein kinase